VYSEAGGGALLGGGVGALGLAATGFNVMASALIAFVLIVLGLLLLRMTSVELDDDVAGPEASIGTEAAATP
jgi:hypothetical protein